VLPVVDFAAVADSGYADAEVGVVYGVDDAVIANADAPLLLATFEFLASGGAWFGCERFQLWKDALNELCREFFEFLAGAGFEFDRILSHAVCRGRSGRP